MLKTAKRIAAAFGLHVVRRSSVPYGYDKFADVAKILPDLKLALDVGGNYGQTVAEMRVHYPSAYIISFEPMPAIFEDLKRNTARDSNVQCVPYAVGSEAGTATMTALEHTGQNTMNLSAKPDAPTVEVPVIALDQFCAEHGIGGVDLLKIDTEGYEVEVLKGAMGLLSSGSIRAVLVEVEFYPNPSEPHGDFFAISQILIPLGYRVFAVYDEGKDEQGWRWGDVLFILPTTGERHHVDCSPFA
jgi:FkbM family methyltransferase